MSGSQSSTREKTSRTVGGGRGRSGAFTWLCCIAALASCRPGPGELDAPASLLSEATGESSMTTWTCTGSPCPWGGVLANHALPWPASAAPVATRLGYTASPAAYLPAASANGAIVSIDAGSAGVYAGEPSGSSHRLLAVVSEGASYQVSGLADGEVLSVQSADSFDYRVTPPAPPDAPDAGVPDAPAPDAGASDAGTPDAGAPDAAPPLTSRAVTWTCTGTPCPWGDPVTGNALVWPSDTGAIATRLGYTVSAGIYLPAVSANGASVSIVTGAASAYAGRPGDTSHRLLATLNAGQTLQVTGLAGGEVLSVQADGAFTYRATLPPPGDPGDPPDEVIPSKQARWRCNIPECHGEDWTGAVIAWPSWAAYQSNARSGDQSRSVFATDGTPLYPYMGSWAQGCEVTAESGTVLIIEWQRGTDVWRETWLSPRQSHVIHLVPPENGAMIETADGSPGFSVSLKNCTPQPLAP
jgi:hypothetical protein